MTARSSSAFRAGLLAALFVVGQGASAQAAINLPRLGIPGLGKKAPFTSCVNQITDFVGGGAYAIGEFGTDGARNRNLRSAYVTAGVEPNWTTAGKAAKTPMKYLSKLRPEGVMLGAAYDYIPAANGQESVQFNHIMVRAPFVTGSDLDRRNPVGAVVRLSLGDAVYEGPAKIEDGGIEFYVSASHPDAIGYVQLRQADRAAFARAAASQTPFQVTVLDQRSKIELYSATVSMAPGLKQKGLMDQALAAAAPYWAKGYDSPFCHPEGVSID